MLQGTARVEDFTTTSKGLRSKVLFLTTSMKRLLDGCYPKLKQVPLRERFPE